MRKKAPLIGITCRSLEDLPRCPDLYAEAVDKAGGSSFFIPAVPEVKGLADRCAGLIIPGGSDPAPDLYGEKRLYRLEIEDPGRIIFDLALLSEIIRLRKPVLGICYGMQLINIFFGGTLYQDIRSQVPGSLKHEGEMHSIIIEDNPNVRSGEFVVNSFHHQAVKDPGRGVIPFASAGDGIAEAFYLKECRFILGVQWHPERMQSPLNTQLFEAFVEACRDYQ
jgi:putative glutamine amidotransferase